MCNSMTAKITYVAQQLSAEPWGRGFLRVRELLGAMGLWVDWRSAFLTQVAWVELCIEQNMIWYI
jgi:hypothetical protein